MKRLLDIFLVLVVAPFWLPLMGLVALAVRCKLGAPVFFTQERAGLNGKPFRMVKFRSMLTGEGSDAERLTPFGKMLRATSLDELPELLTGWAQVNGRNLLSWEEKFARDVWYVDHRSLALDFKILVLTVATVFRSTGISAQGEATMGEFKGTQS